MDDLIIAVVGTAFFIGVPIAFLLWSDRRKIRKAAPEDKAHIAERVRSQNRETFVALIVGAPLIVLFMTGVISKWVILAGVGVYVVVIIVHRWIANRIKHPETREAIELCQAGDIDGALVVVRRALDENPESAELWNVRCALLMEQENWEEALEAIEAAENFGLDSSMVAINKAQVLWRLSRIDEALKLNDEECRRNPQNFVAAAYQCRFLIELDRRDEAEEQLRSVEKIHKSEVVFPKQERIRRRELLEELRARVAEM